MDLDDIVGGLKGYVRKKYHELQLKIALDDALSGQFADSYPRSPLLKAGSLAVTPFALASALAPAAVISEPYAKEAEAQQDPGCNAYEVGLGLINPRLTTTLSQQFPFSPCDVSDIVIGSTRVAYATQPGTDILYQRVPSEAQARAISTTGMNVPIGLDFDRMPGNEQFVLLQNQSYVLNPTANVDDVQNAIRRQGIAFPNREIERMFGMFPQKVVAIYGAGTLGFLFPNQGSNINASNATYLPLGGRPVDVRSNVSDLERQLRRDYSNFTSVDNIGFFDGKLILFERRASEYVITVNASNLQNGTPLQYARFTILGIDGKECTTAENGRCVITRMPASFTGIKDVIAEKDGFSPSHLEVMLDGRNTIVNRAIVPANFDWEFYDDVARPEGVTQKQRDLRPYSSNIPNGTKYFITRDNSQTSRVITDNDVNTAIDVMKQAVYLVSNGSVQLTNNDISIIRTPKRQFVESLVGTLRGEAYYVVDWEDIAARLGIAAGTGFSPYPNTNYIAFSNSTFEPGLSRGVYFHEFLLGLGLDETRRRRPQDTILDPSGGSQLEYPTPQLDQPAILLFGIRLPGHETRTINGRVIRDSSPLNR